MRRSSLLELDARGRRLRANDVSEVVVARYGRSVSELEARFLDIELIADEIWRGDVSSTTTADLSSLINAAGVPFAGIDANGTWLVALLCGACLDPAPAYLTILTACSTGS